MASRINSTTISLSKSVKTRLRAMLESSDEEYLNWDDALVSLMNYVDSQR